MHAHATSSATMAASSASAAIARSVSSSVEPLSGLECGGRSFLESSDSPCCRRWSVCGRLPIDRQANLSRSRLSPSASLSSLRSTSTCNSYSTRTRSPSLPSPSSSSCFPFTSTSSWLGDSGYGGWASCPATTVDCSTSSVRLSPNGYGRRSSLAAPVGLRGMKSCPFSSSRIRLKTCKAVASSTREEVGEGTMEGEGFKLPPEELPENGFERFLVSAERLFNVFSTGIVIKAIDMLYEERPYARFYVLETIARVPYFAFLSVLHMYESFGWWRRADYLKVHFAESWNELHHLLVMEALGGDERWIDRFLAQHVSVAYYAMTASMYLLSPRMAYHFQEMVERHAFATYDKFIREHGEKLKLLPAPEVAVRYYTQGELYMFDEFQTTQVPESRRPKINNLYDVFVNIRADEAEHCKTMRACQRPGSLSSPHRDSPAAAPTCYVDAVRRGETDGNANEEEGEDSEREAMERTRAALNTAFMADCMVPPAECSGIFECATTAMSYSDRRKLVTGNSGKALNGLDIETEDGSIVMGAGIIAPAAEEEEQQRQDEGSLRS